MVPDDGTDLATPARETALACIDAGIQAAQPQTLVPEAVSLDGEILTIDDTTYDLRPYSRVLVLGGGKAAGELARALEDVLGDRITDGLVVTDTPVETTTITVVEGSHPIPNEAAVEGTDRLLELAAAAGEDTLILLAITGGGSALLPAPAATLSLADIQRVTEDLLDSGATIHESNCVRKHLSRSKGGQLARLATPATVAGLVISDVVGDDLDVIASGPIVPDTTTFADALEICDRYEITLPESVADHLSAGIEGTVPETPGPDAPFFETVAVHVLANGGTALGAARDVATDHGYNTLILSSRLEGEAREVGTTYAAIAAEIRATGNPIAPPAVVLGGGETTVTVTGNGRGGPNQELAVSASMALSDPDTVIASVDTDGIDGRSDAAGALVDHETATPREDARTALERNDVTPFLAPAGALVRTGPTGTNVNDLHVVVVPAAES